MTERSTSVKRLAALSAALAIALGACGTAAPPSAPPAASSSQAAATASAAAVESVSPTVDPATVTGDITVSLWDYGNPDSKTWLADFNKVYPNVHVELKNVDLNAYRQALQLQLTSGQTSDIVQLYESDTPQYKDVLEDLEPYAVKTWGADWKSKFAPGALDQQIIDGKVVGMPQYLAGPGSLFYSQEVFDKLGLKPPTTYAELKDVATKLKAAGLQALALGVKDGWIDTYVYRIIALQADAKAQAEAAQCKRPWTDPALVKAMQVWSDLFTDGILSKDQLAQAQYPDAVDALTTQKAGTLFNGTWHNQTLTNAGYKVYIDGRTLPDPSHQYVLRSTNFPAVIDGAKPVYALGTHGWGINPQSTNKDAAWAFIAWYVSEPGQKWIADSTYIPVWAGMAPSYTDVITPDQVNDIKTQTDYIQTGGGYVGPTLILTGEQTNALTDALQGVATGAQTPDAAMAAVQAASGC